MVCGDDVARRKPEPDLIIKALDELPAPRDQSCRFVGDSAADVVAGKRAGATAIFYNGAGWETGWIDKIFPGTTRHPHRPDGVVRSLDELVQLTRLVMTVGAEP